MWALCTQESVVKISKLVVSLLFSSLSISCYANINPSDASMSEEIQKLISELKPIDKQWYQLRNAVYSKDYSGAELLLKSAPKLITHTNLTGETVLHFLAVENDIEGVKWLKSKEFDIDTKNDFGTPVIFEVAQLGYKELLIWFYENGANFSAKDGEDFSLIEYLEEWEKPDMAKFVMEKCT